MQRSYPDHISRLVSLETGQPLQIDDDDCDVDLPYPVDDQYIMHTGVAMPVGVEPSQSPFTAVIHIARFVGQLRKTLRSSTIDAAILSEFDVHFARSMVAFPAHCQFGSTLHLEPQSLPPLLHLQNSRLVLHRHNLSTMCHAEVRSIALDHCVAVARDTAHLLSRVMHTPATALGHGSDNAPWQSKVAAAATASLCMHAWRCTLLLVCRGYYAEAMTCVEISAAVGELRAVNTACGRHLSFFLRMLVEKLHDRRRGGYSNTNLEHDEEMMAYVSGDLQGSVEDNWVWQGSVPEGSMDPQAAGLTQATRIPSIALAAPSYRDLPASTPGGLSAEEASNWGGWDQILWRVQTLLQDRPLVTPSGGLGRAYGPPPLSTPPPGSVPHPVLPQPRGPPSSSTSTPTSRISIASII